MGNYKRLENKYREPEATASSAFPLVAKRVSKSSREEYLRNWRKKYPLYDHTTYAGSHYITGNKSQWWSKTCTPVLGALKIASTSKWAVDGRMEVQITRVPRKGLFGMYEDHIKHAEQLMARLEDIYQYAANAGDEWDNNDSVQEELKVLLEVIYFKVKGGNFNVRLLSGHVKTIDFDTLSSGVCLDSRIRKISTLYRTMVSYSMHKDTSKKLSAMYDKYHKVGRLPELEKEETKTLALAKIAVDYLVPSKLLSADSKLVKQFTEMQSWPDAWAVPTHDARKARKQKREVKAEQYGLNMPGAQELGTTEKPMSLDMAIIRADSNHDFLVKGIRNGEEVIASEENKNRLLQIYRDHIIENAQFPHPVVSVGSTTMRAIEMLILRHLSGNPVCQYIKQLNLLRRDPVNGFYFDKDVTKEECEQFAVKLSSIYKNIISCTQDVPQACIAPGTASVFANPEKPNIYEGDSFDYDDGLSGGEYTDI